MRFDLSPEQLMFAEAVERALANASGCPDRCSDLRLIGTAESLSAAGEALSLLPLAIAAEATGRHLAPWTVLRAALARYLTRDQVVVHEGVAAWDGEFVFALGNAPTRTVEGDPREGRIFWQAGEVLELHGSGTSAEPLERADVSRPAYRVTRPDGQPLAIVPGAAMVRDALLILRAADSFGAASAALEMTLDYAVTRHQFGRPIASFQAYQHQLAELALALDPCRFLWWRAAHLWTRADMRERQAALAKAHICETAVTVTRAMVELHGAIGFTAEYPLHKFVKRAADNWAAIAPPARLRDRVATLADW